MRRLRQCARASGIVVAMLMALTQARVASSATLYELLNGGSLDAGAARFSNWTLKSLDATGSPNPDLALISVTPLVTDPASPGFQFAANGQLATTGINAVDLVLDYRVQSVGGGKSFAGHSLALSSIVFGGASGVAYVSHDVATTAGADLGPTLAVADHQSNFLQLNDDAAHAPHHSLTAELNVFLNGLAATDSITLSTFVVRFAQTGPAALTGDFNQDARVDGADFIAWQRGLSPTPRSPQDLADWRAHYGESITITAATMAAPEPSAAALLACFALAAGALRRRAS